MMTPQERRELIERPFPPIRTLPKLPVGGTGVTKWQNGTAAVEGQMRCYNGTSLIIGHVLYGEDYYRW